MKRRACIEKGKRGRRVDARRKDGCLSLREEGYTSEENAPHSQFAVDDLDIDSILPRETLDDQKENERKSKILSWGYSECRAHNHVKSTSRRLAELRVAELQSCRVASCELRAILAGLLGE